MSLDEHMEWIQAEMARAILHRFATPSVVAFPDANAQRSPQGQLLLPPANPAYHREPLYDEQDIDGYTIAEAQAALDAFKRDRQNKA